MIGGSTLTLLLGVLGLLGGLGLVVGGYFYWKWRKTVGRQLEESFKAGEEMVFDPPNVTFTPIDYFRAMRHLQTQRKAAKKGYVKWFVLGSNMQRPRWVKPKADGSGPKITRDGKPYYFEKDAMTTDERTGAWVAVHREGESDPINLRDPAYPGIEADRMERIINLEAESKPPGWLDGLDMDQQTIMWLGIGVLFILFAGYRYLGGAA